MKKRNAFIPAAVLATAFVIAQPHFAGAAENEAAADSNAASERNKSAEPDKSAAPEPAVARQNHVNVRGQPQMNSEIITHLQKGQPVTVLEEITLKKPKPDEPPRWYRIYLPTNSFAWVHSSFIELTNKSVIPRRLNLRGGPGENYSILGRIDRGTVISEIGSKENWIKIEAPPHAYGFVAAHLLSKQSKPAEVVPSVVTSPSITPVPTPPVEAAPPAPTIVAPPVEIAKAPTTIPDPATRTTPDFEVAPSAPKLSLEPQYVKRVATREGLLRGSVSIQAPTYFELRSLDTGKAVNYVLSPSTNLVLKNYKGQRIIVTGEELLDERWPHTPVITVETLKTVP